MKRALAILVALCTFGALGFSQIAIKGSWTTTLCLVPSTSLTSTLSLTYNVAGFDITGAFRFTAAGLDRVSFTGKGALGPFSLTSRMWFNPTVPEYMGSDLVTSFDFGGVGLGLTVRHWDTDYNSCFFATACWPFGPWRPDTTTCQQTGAYGMQYILSLKVDPISGKLYFEDCCEGIEFLKAILELKGVGLCCGITYDATLTFVKEGGFESLVIAMYDIIQICCGISFDFTITFTEDSKSIELTPKFAGFGDACFTVYGDVADVGYYPAIEIYGFKIKCTLGDCNYLEIVNAIDVAGVEGILGDIFLATCGEFEYIALGFCGAGCCGGKYTADLKIYFGSNGGLFDLTRMVYSVKIPIMANFTLNLDGTVAAATCASNSFCLGWTFTF